MRNINSMFQRREVSCFNLKTHCTVIEKLKQHWEDQFSDRLRKMDQGALSRTTVEELLKEVFEYREDPLHHFELGTVSGQGGRAKFMARDGIDLL